MKHKLNIRKIAAIKPTGGKQVFNDGDGLRLIVEANGSKRWLLRRMVEGKDKETGLGGYPAVSLDEARKAAADIRKGVALPVARIGLVVVPTEGITLEPAVRAYHADNESEWTPKKAKNWIGRFENYVFPVIGNLGLRELTGAHMLAVFKPIWKTKSATANNVRCDLRVVLKTARVNGQCGGDALDAIEDACDLLGKQPQGKHRAALDVEAVPGFMRDLADSGATESLKLCMAFTVLTVKRSSEVRKAEWKEYNEKTGVWTIPAGRLKYKNRGDHPEPLSDAAQHILRLAKQAAGSSRYMFPSPFTGEPYTDCPLLELIQPYGATVHGLRATMKSWAQAQTVKHNGVLLRVYPDDITELALAHMAYSKVEAAYQRNTLLDMRLALANEWAKVALGGRPLPQLLLAA